MTELTLVYRLVLYGEKYNEGNKQSFARIWPTRSKKFILFKQFYSPKI
jgi:hypothetical protein